MVRKKEGWRFVGGLAAEGCIVFVTR